MVLQVDGASRMPPVITSPTSPSAWQPTMEMERRERIVVVMVVLVGAEDWVPQELGIA